MSKKDVLAGEERWLKAFNGGDAAGVAACYAEDARLMPPNADIVSGRPAIESFCKEFIALNATLSFDLVTVHEAGDLSVAVGRYEMDLRPTGADPQHDSGKFIEVWTKDKDGEWRIADDIFNSSVPLPS